MDDFAETIYSLLIYFLIEWHEDKLLRCHIMSNFIDLFRQEKVLQMHQLIDPLCKIILQNLRKEEFQDRRYLDMQDYTFFWELANKNRVNVASALTICKIMQNGMLKRDPQYRTVADKIFFKLMSRFSNEDAAHAFIQ